MQYKNLPKSSFKQYGYEEEERGKRVLSPKYSTQTSDQYSPRNLSSKVQTGSPRHWKSYLAPQLTRMSPRDAELEFQPQPETGSSRLKGYSSVYNLREGGNSSAYLEQRTGTQQVRKEEYGRRRQEIMNRIKLLQERSLVEEGSPAQVSRVGLQGEDLLARVAALEQRVDGLAAEFEAKMKREMADLERRLKAELKQR